MDMDENDEYAEVSDFSVQYGGESGSRFWVASVEVAFNSNSIEAA